MNKLTFAAASKLLRARHPAEWQALTKAQQRALVDRYNAEITSAAEAKAWIEKQLNDAKRRT